MGLKDWTIRRKLNVSVGLVIFMVLMVIGFSVFVIGEMTEFKQDVINYRTVQHEVKIAKDLQLRVANICRRD